MVSMIRPSRCPFGLVAARRRATCATRGRHGVHARDGQARGITPRGMPAEQLAIARRCSGAEREAVDPRPSRQVLIACRCGRHRPHPSIDKPKPATRQARARASSTDRFYSQPPTNRDASERLQGAFRAASAKGQPARPVVRHESCRAKREPRQPLRGNRSRERREAPDRGAPRWRTRVHSPTETNQACTSRAERRARTRGALRARDFANATGRCHSSPAR